MPVVQKTQLKSLLVSETNFPFPCPQDNAAKAPHKCKEALFDYAPSPAQDKAPELPPKVTWG